MNGYALATVQTTAGPQPALRLDDGRLLVHDCLAGSSVRALLDDWDAAEQVLDEIAAAPSAGRFLDPDMTTLLTHASGDIDPATMPSRTPPPGARALMGEDPRLPTMPEAPTLVDFFRYRLMSKAHLLQSAKLALDTGHEEKIVLACLLHDIAVCGLIRADHGYWGEQLIAPYVDPEISWAVRAHQALRFFPDESVGYEYPEAYAKWFGTDYEPELYIQEEYRQARKHRWYMTARLITLNDLYAFDPTMEVSIDIFTDIIGRHFKQPREGLGFDGSASAHMWRTMISPTRFL